MNTETSRQYRSLALGFAGALGIVAIAIFRFKLPKLIKGR